MSTANSLKERVESVVLRGSAPETPGLPLLVPYITSDLLSRMLNVVLSHDKARAAWVGEAEGARSRRR